MKALGNKSLSAILATVINIAWWIEWIAGTVLIVAISIAALTKKDVSLTVPVNFSSINFKTISSVNKAMPDGQLQVLNGNFAFPVSVTWQNTLLILTGAVMVFAVLLLITYQLKHIFKNFRRNQPFNELNIPRIKNLGILFICAAILQWLFTVAINLFLNTHFQWGSDINLTYHFEVSFIVSGITLIIVAEIFRKGFVIEEDNNLTI